jgi:hypothetical protein
MSAQKQAPEDKKKESACEYTLDGLQIQGTSFLIT